MTSTAAKSIYIVAAKRTPFGSFGGSLKSISATDLAARATSAALQSIDLDPKAVGAVFMGNCIQSSPDAPYLARHVALKSGCVVETPALTINRLCGSGFETIVQACYAMRLDSYGIVVAGGTENMSSASLAADGNDVRWGVNLGTGLKLRDTLWDGLTDSYAGCAMGMTAENLAENYNITRQECDEFAIRSQQTWADAKKAGVFDSEIVPIEIKGRKGKVVQVDTDEHPRPESTMEQISSLKPVFKADGGVVTAANASGICDGAGSIVLATEEAVSEHNLTPLARVASYHTAGVEPTIMGIGPVPAIRTALDKVGLSLGSADVDRVEINEAFAAQFLACAKELELDMERTNMNGGAISLGHPLAASGSRIVAHLVHDFGNRKDGGRYHVGSACIGGGQGIAVVLERA